VENKLARKSFFKIPDIVDMIYRATDDNSKGVKKNKTRVLLKGSRFQILVPVCGAHPPENYARGDNFGKHPNEVLPLERNDLLIYFYLRFQKINVAEITYSF
jgi:hypothetical protein